MSIFNTLVILFWILTKLIELIITFIDVIKFKMTYLEDIKYH